MEYAVESTWIEESSTMSSYLSSSPSEAPGNASAVVNITYCQSLRGFRPKYMMVHGYMSLLVCIFGCVANALNIAVLTRREMSSPTNSILTGLAFADLFVMVDYVPYALHTYLLTEGVRSFEERYSYSWAHFVIFHANFSQVCHTVSIWLTVTLAVWRYIAVAHPQRNRDWCRRETTLVAIGAAYVISPLLCIPQYFSHVIQKETVYVDSEGKRVVKPEEKNSTSDYRNVTCFTVRIREQGTTMRDINFWTYSVVIKLLPCIVLTVLLLRIVCALLEAKRRRNTLLGRGTPRVPGVARRPAEKSRHTDRTTKMLLAVLLLFLATELPQALLGLLSGIYGPVFFEKCYQPLGELMDFLALLNSAINFILYCTMSKQFRTTFNAMFRPRILDQWKPLSRRLSTSDHNGHTLNYVTQV